jgi:hypothetical protein
VSALFLVASIVTLFMSEWRWGGWLLAGAFGLALASSYLYHRSYAQQYGPPTSEPVQQPPPPPQLPLMFHVESGATLNYYAGQGHQASTTTTDVQIIQGPSAPSGFRLPPPRTGPFRPGEHDEKEDDN